MTAGIGPIEKYKCKNCGHDCHCHEKECTVCVNDVCTDCDCNSVKEDIPSSFFKPTNL